MKSNFKENLYEIHSVRFTSTSRKTQIARVWTLMMLVALLFVTTGCNTPTLQVESTPEIAVVEPTHDLMATAQANVFITNTPQPTPQPTKEVEPVIAVVAEPTNEPMPTFDPNRKPPELPKIFVSDLLNPRDKPHTYEEDTCQFLKNRWGAGKSQPGTIVMVIMYHSIVTGDETSVSYDNQVSSEKHNQMMENLKAQGFEAIDMHQFVSFMLYNDYIPERSALIISDDRHFEGYFRDHFKPYYDKYGWKVVNGWISAPDTSPELWAENQKVSKEGYVDHQAHGVIHNINMTDQSTDEFLYGELQGSIDKIQEYYGHTPEGIIWPGGNFGFRPIEIAKEVGYKVGFTVNPRGPVMYNWIPLLEGEDPTRPAFLQDGNQDPLFVIPRYWNTDASQHIDTVRQIGKSAKEYILANRETEIEYYNIVCAPKLGPLGE